MDVFALIRKMAIVKGSEGGDDALRIFHMAAYFAPTDIRIGAFSPIISDRSELKAAISLLSEQSLVQCPRENTFFVPVDIGAMVRTSIHSVDSISGFSGREDILKRAIRILDDKSRSRLSDYPHSISLYTHAKGHPRVLEEMGDLPGVIVMGMMKDLKFLEAAEFGKECHGYLTEILGENHKVVLNLECALGIALLMVEKEEEAIKLLTTAYDKSCRFGFDSEIETAMKALATVICNPLSLSVESAEVRLRSLIFPGLSFSESNSDSELKKWVDYAAILLEFDLTAEALSILDGVITRRTEISGQGDVRVFAAMELKAYTLAASSNKHLEAMELLKHVYEEKRKIFGPLNMKTIHTKGLIGNVLFLKGDLEEAMTLLEDVVSNLTQIDRESIDLYEKEMTEMIEICIQQEDLVKGLKLSSDLHDKLVSVFGEVYPRCFKCRKQKSDILLKLNQPEKALEVLKRLLEDYKYEMDEEELGRLSTEMRRVENIPSFDAPAGTLHSFAKDGNSEMVLSLIEGGRDIESKDSKGLTPLHYASAFGQVEVAKVLIGKGAKTSSKSPSTPPEVAKEMTTLLRTVQSFFEAVKANDSDGIVGIASKEPCVVRARDDQGCTPLHWASLRGYGGTVRLLLEFGSDPTAVSDKGNSALHIAASKGHATIAETLLLSLGPSEVTAALDGRTCSGGNTPLHAAAEKGHVEAVRSLLRHGAVCDAQNAAGKTPAMVSEDWGCRNLLGLVEGLFRDASSGDVAAVCAKLRGLESGDVLAVSKARNRGHRTLLQEAMEQKNLVLAKKLVKLLKYDS